VSGWMAAALRLNPGEDDGMRWPAVMMVGTCSTGKHRGGMWPN
jgi:hypothetical protein